jgi:hypothetical protein
MPQWLENSHRLLVRRARNAWNPPRGESGLRAPRTFGGAKFRIKAVQIAMAHEPFTLKLTTRQAQALRALAALEDLPPEVYAAEVLARHLYHAYTPEVARRAESASTDDALS